VEDRDIIEEQDEQQAPAAEESPDLSISVKIDATKNPKIFEVEGVPIHGKAAVKRALKAEAASQIDQRVEIMFAKAGE
jgi:hypothetical protein